MTNYFCHDTAVIDSPCRIGSGTKIWHFSHLMSGCKLGNDCTVGQNVYIASTVTIGHRTKIQNNVSLYDGVQIEEDVFIGPSAVFTNVKNPRAHRDQSGRFSQTKVKKGATIGANATIICGCTVGEYAFIGAGAVVTKNVSPHALMVGVPAKQCGWVCQCGEPLTGKNACNKCHCAAEEFQNA